jgi:hypothetical protein
MAAMARRIVVREAFAFDRLVYVPGIEVPPEAWLRLPQRKRNRLLNTAKVELLEG